eukprot:s466_g1.t1
MADVSRLAKRECQALLSELLRDQPADPYAFMLQRLKASKDNGGLKPSEGDTVMLRASDGAAGASVTSFVRDELMNCIK